QVRPFRIEAGESIQNSLESFCLDQLSVERLDSNVDNSSTVRGQLLHGVGKVTADVPGFLLVGPLRVALPIDSSRPSNVVNVLVYATITPHPSDRGIHHHGETAASLPAATDQFLELP